MPWSGVRVPIGSRPDLDGGISRAWIVACLSCLAIVAIVATIPVLLTGVYPGVYHDRSVDASFASMTLLVLAMGVLAQPKLTPQAATVATLRAALHLIGAGSVVGIVLVHSTREAAERQDLPAITTLIVVAFVEEVVFRILLVQRIERALRGIVRTGPARLAAVVLAQLTFAACHFRYWLADSVHWPTMLSLFGAGVLLWFVRSHAGLWAAVTLHALVNANALPLPGMAQEYALTVLGLGGVLPLLMLAMDLRTRRPEAGRPGGVGEVASGSYFSPCARSD